MEVYISQTNIVSETDKDTGETIETPETLLLYETDPLKCTFGFANPSYNLAWDSFCKQVLLPKVENKPDPEPTDPDPEPTEPNDSTDPETGKDDETGTESGETTSEPDDTESNNGSGPGNETEENGENTNEPEDGEG